VIVEPSGDLLEVKSSPGHVYVEVFDDLRALF